MPPTVDRRTLLAMGAMYVVAIACTDQSDAGLEPIFREAASTDPPGEDGAQTESTARTLAMIGDSITFMSTEPLQSTLSATGLEVLAIDAQVGRRISVGADGRPHSGVDIAAFIANSAPPDVWVIALGTNDIGQYADAAEFAVEVQSLLDVLPSAAPLVWVDTWDGGRPEETRLVNDTLRVMARTRDDVVVVDWASRADDEGVMSGDEVHPTDAGTLVFAQVVAEGVGALLASL